MQILFAASECAPFVKTGGLADVAAALPKALAEIGVDVRVLLPGYPAVRAALPATARAHPLQPVFGYEARLHEGRAEGLDLLVLDAPALYEREGGPYLGPDRRDWHDNHLRFGALSAVAARIAARGAGDWRADVLHVHDWQAGLAPAYLRLVGASAPPSVLTIHNVAFQGVFPAETMSQLELPWELFHPDALEYHGHMSFLKAGLVYADKITTVSPTYARELMTPTFGMGLEGVVAARRNDVAGILNGVDLDAWNPATDRNLAARYRSGRLDRKARNRAALAERFGVALPESAPLFCVISRLTRQKGLDLLLAALPRLLARGAGLVLLGSGDYDLEHGFAVAAAGSEGRVGVEIGYDEPLSHLIMAGADAILVPSRFEPCGLTQLYGLRYATLPVVARTGGLADTVIDANEAALAAGVATGFQFEPESADALGTAIERACEVYARPKTWRTMMQRAVRHPVGWEPSARAYAAIYDEIVSKRRAEEAPSSEARDEPAGQRDERTAEPPPPPSAQRG